MSVARTAERMIQLKRNAAMANAFGVEAHVISLDEAASRYPLMRTDDLVGAVWIPGDGKANPADITQALARGPARAGRGSWKASRSPAVNVVNGAVTGVETSAGPIATRDPGQLRRACGRASSGA